MIGDENMNYKKFYGIGLLVLLVSIVFVFAGDNLTYKMASVDNGDETWNLTFSIQCPNKTMDGIYNVSVQITSEEEDPRYNIEYTFPAMNCTFKSGQGIISCGYDEQDPRMQPLPSGNYMFIGLWVLNPEDPNQQIANALYYDNQSLNFTIPIPPEPPGPGPYDNITNDTNDTGNGTVPGFNDNGGFPGFGNGLANTGFPLIILLVLIVAGVFYWRRK
jgi:hypothetical protein